MLAQGRPRVTAPCVRPFSAASTPPRVSRFENATPGYGAEHRVLAALAGGCVALRARGQNAVMTLAPVDEKRPDAKLEEVFLVQTPLVLPPPFPASLAQLLPKHAIVAARLATGGFVAFDFTPEAPEDPVGALQLLLGGSVPGRLARRSMARLPRSAVRLGRAKADTTVRAVEAVEAAFEPRLSLGKNDCNSYAEKVLEALLADKQKVLEERLFSTLDWEGEDTQELRYKEPSVLNAVVLVAGTTVGAGILALPAVTQPVGFVPSMAALSFSWIYMAVTGLFIAEVACRTMAATGKRNISLQSMAISSVGQAGAWLSSGAFVFLHMALLIAYCSKGGELLLSLGLAALPIPGPLLFAGIFGGFVFVAKGSEALERGNNAFAIVVVASFLALVALALPGGDPSRLLSVAEWSKASDTVPTLLLSLVYHNVVPSVCAQLEGDRKKITTAIVVGSFVPFMMFVVWNAAVLAALPPGGGDPLELLRASGNPMVSGGIVAFSLSAIVTSFVGFVVALTDFFADLLGDRETEATNEATKVRDFGLTLAVPVLVACLDPSLFFQAIDKAGAFGVSTLFGLLPAWMVLQQRAQESPLLARKPGFLGGYKRGPLVPGGPLVPLAVALVALLVVGDNALELLGA